MNRINKETTNNAVPARSGSFDTNEKEFSRAALYEVETSNLNKAVKRNIERFPADFMFQLTKAEWENLIFQIGISSQQHGGRRFMP